MNGKLQLHSTFWNTGLQDDDNGHRSLCTAKVSYPSFKLGLVDGTVVEEKPDGVDLTNVFVDDFRIPRVFVSQQAA